MERNLDGSLAYCDIHVKEIKDVSALSDKVEKWTDRLLQANGIGKRISSLDGANDIMEKDASRRLFIFQVAGVGYHPCKGYNQRIKKTPHGAFLLFQ